MCFCKKFEPPSILVHVVVDRMADPAELLVIKDQHAFASQCLNRGLEAEEANNKAEALSYYRMARQHLTQGMEVPTQGERQSGEAWDKARGLQQKMKDMLEAVNTHFSDLEKSPENTNDGLLIDLTSNMYQDLVASSQPSNSPLHHLYPTIPAASPAPSTAHISPATCAVPNTPTLPAEAEESVTMDISRDQPPAYTPKPTNGHHSLWRGWSAQPAAATGRDEKELLYIPSGVQLFFVEPSGQVSALSHPSYLRIVAVESHNNNSGVGKPSATLHACDRMYPLTTDKPVLLANSGIFMFPDSLSDTPGSYVGLVLSSELPAADCEMFQDLLLQLTDFRVQATEGAEVEVLNLTTKVPLDPLKEQTAPAAETEKALLPGWSEKMAQGILSGATRLSESFTKGAEATGRAIQKGAAKIRDRITPEETPSEVSPQVTKGLNATQQATGGAVRVTKLLVNGMSTIAGHVADKMAPHLKKHGPKLVPQALKKSQDGQGSNFDGAKFVAASSVQGFCTVWSSLEAGAKDVCKSVAAETVTTVKYKYGNDAGEATNTALKSVGNIGIAANNLDNLGIKAFIKAAGKKTTRNMAGTTKEELAETEEKKVRREEQQSQTEGGHVQKKEEEKMKE